MPGRLTQDQIEQYRRDGFVSPVRAISADKAKAVRARVEAFEAAQGAPLHGTQRTQCFLLFPWIWELVTGPAVLDAVEDLIGPDILIYQSAAWIKEPGSGSYVSWHQDVAYFGMDPVDCVSVWIALTPADEAAGCMRVLPGSHREGLLPVDYTEVRDTNMLASGQRVRYPVDEAAAVPMPLSPGEMSLHHANLIHSSGPNVGAGRRMGFTAVCIAPHVRQTTEARAGAVLVRGEDRYGHYELHKDPPTAPDDAETAAVHARAVELYRGKAQECGNRNAWRLG